MQNESVCYIIHRGKECLRIVQLSSTESIATGKTSNYHKLQNYFQMEGNLKMVVHYFIMGRDGED